MVVEAPCDLRLLAKDRVALGEGAAWFEVSAEAVGFSVETQQLTVIDLGTAFGIDASRVRRRREDRIRTGRGPWHKTLL